MQLTRSSLCSILLDNGEEDLAVLIARASLPDILDSAADASALASLGLSEEDLQALLPAVSGSELTDGTDDVSMVQRKQTISDRWANLVTSWTGDSRARLLSLPRKWMDTLWPRNPGPPRPICGGRAVGCCRPSSQSS